MCKVTFKERLKKLRIENKIIQKDVAEVLGITRQAVSYYENGEREPGIKELIILADLFDVSIDYLVGRTDER